MLAAQQAQDGAGPQGGEGGCAFVGIEKGSANMVASRDMLLDSGANIHVTPFDHPGSRPGPGIEVVAANGASQFGDRVVDIGNIKDVNIIPKFHRGLFSAGKLVDESDGGGHLYMADRVYAVNADTMTRVRDVLGTAPVIARRGEQTGGLYVCTNEILALAAEAYELKESTKMDHSREDKEFLKDSEDLKLRNLSCNSGETKGIVNGRKFLKDLDCGSGKTKDMDTDGGKSLQDSKLLNGDSGETRSMDEAASAPVVAPWGVRRGPGPVVPVTRSPPQTPPRCSRAGSCSSRQLPPWARSPR